MIKLILAAVVASTFLFSGIASSHIYHSQGYKLECFDEEFQVWYKSGSNYIYYGWIHTLDELVDLVAANPGVSGFAREIDICDGHIIRQENFSNGSF